jgi:hypothetical protein
MNSPEVEQKYAVYTERELMVRLLDLLDKENAKPLPTKKKSRKPKVESTVELSEDPIKSDITKMLEKPKKRRKPKEEDEEYGEIDHKLENEEPRQRQEEPKTFLQVEEKPVKEEITEKPVKQRQTQAKLFKDDLLMTIDPNERKKVIETTKNELIQTAAPPIKEDEAKRNISNFLTTYSKNKKY